MVCIYENEGLKEKKIEKISKKISIRKIFSIRPKSTPTTIKGESSQKETHNRQPTLWVYPLGKTLSLYSSIIFFHPPQPL